MNATGMRGVGFRFLRYLRDPQVPRWRKLTGLFALLYFVMPVDLIPDVPFIGWLDDLGVLSATAAFLLREVHRYRPEVSGPPPVEGDRPNLPPR